jgi:hypothetical protein
MRPMERMPRISIRSAPKEEALDFDALHRAHAPVVLQWAARVRARAGLARPDPLEPATHS